LGFNPTKMIKLNARTQQTKIYLCRTILTREDEETYSFMHIITCQIGDLMNVEIQEKEVGEKNSLFKVLVDTTIILAFFTGFLYASGMAYYNAFLNHWGLDAANFSRSFHEMAYVGLVTVFNSSISTISQIAIWVSFLSLVLLVGIVLTPDTTLTKWLRKKIKFRLSDWKEKQISEIQKVLVVNAGVLAVFVVLGLLLYSSEKLGEKKAHNIHGLIKSGMFRNDDFKLLSTLSSKNDNEKSYMRFYLIACNLLECAVFWKDAEEVEVIERKSIQGAYLLLPFQEAGSP